MLDQSIEQFNSETINSLEGLETFLQQWNTSDNNCTAMSEKLLEYRIKLLLNLKKVYTFLYEYYSNLNREISKKELRGKISEKVCSILQIQKRDERKKYRALLCLLFLFQNKIVKNTEQLILAGANVTFFSNLSNKNFGDFIRYISGKKDLVFDMDKASETFIEAGDVNIMLIDE